jgi:Ca-activated chloride channel family protein
VARELAQRLDAPVLTGIEIDWGDAQVADVTPQQIPDLFAGQSVRVQGRYTRPGDHTITVRGRTRHQSAALQLPVSLPEATTAAHRGAIALIWARSAIKDAMHHLITPLERRPDGLANEDIRAQVTELGLQFSLMTHWTAFVAVSEQIYNPDPGNTRARDVPLPMVKGITARAYPQESFHGAGAPEPHEWLAIAVLLLVGLGFELARRRRVVQA